MGARAGALIDHPPQLDAFELALHRHQHKALMPAGVDPTEVVEHPPVDVVQIGYAQILAARLRKDLFQLCGGDGLQSAVFT